MNNNAQVTRRRRLLGIAFAIVIIGTAGTSHALGANGYVATAGQRAQRGPSIRIQTSPTTSRSSRSSTTSTTSSTSTTSTTSTVPPTSGGKIRFPINPSPRCIYLDNFGGKSKTFGSNGHQGVDIGADEGQAVYAVESGVLYRQWTDLSSAPGLAWGLWSDTDVKYRYFHLSGFAPGLQVGDFVRAGDLIGYVGDTGNAASGGWHLHFEVRPGPEPHSETVDPTPLLSIPSSCTVY